VPKPLDVSTVVPAEPPALHSLDEPDHRRYPPGVSKSLETTLLSGLYVGEYIPTFQSVAAGAHRAVDLGQDRTNLTSACREAIGEPGHLRRVAQPSDDGFCFLDRLELRAGGHDGDP
jgi:hypothetical protein